MTGRFYTPADLAEILSVTEEQVLEYRRRYGWPSFKAGKAIRFSQADVEQIIAKHAVTPTTPEAAPILGGQTKRSAARSA